MAWLSYEYDMQTADASRALLLANEKPTMHEVHALLRRLKLYARNGPLPFIEDGGYYEQPYWLSELLECAMRAEQEFFALMELQRAAKP